MAPFHLCAHNRIQLLTNTAFSHYIKLWCRCPHSLSVLGIPRILPVSIARFPHENSKINRMPQNLARACWHPVVSPSTCITHALASLLNVRSIPGLNIFRAQVSCTSDNRVGRGQDALAAGLQEEIEGLTLLQSTISLIEPCQTSKKLARSLSDLLAGGCDEVREQSIAAPSMELIVGFPQHRKTRRRLSSDSL